jgi:hypothetical protein
MTPSASFILSYLDLRSDFVVPCDQLFTRALEHGHSTAHALAALAELCCEGLIEWKTGGEVWGYQITPAAIELRKQELRELIG